MFCKPFFTNNAGATTPSMINPLGFSTSNVSLSTKTMNAINTIELNYISKMNRDDFQNNMTDIDYINNITALYNIVNASMMNSTNSTIKQFLKITLDALDSYYNYKQLYDENTNLNNSINILNEQLDGLTGSRDKTTAVVFAENTIDSPNGFSVTDKPFVLAPLFCYYINTYGMPEQGKGFDIKKLSASMSALKKMGIDPFNDINTV